MGIRLISHPNNPKHKATQLETKHLELGRRGEGRKEGIRTYPVLRVEAGVYDTIHI